MLSGITSSLDSEGIGVDVDGARVHVLVWADIFGVCGTSVVDVAHMVELVTAAFYSRGFVWKDGSLTRLSSEILKGQSLSWEYEGQTF